MDLERLLEAMRREDVSAKKMLDVPCVHSAGGPIRVRVYLVVYGPFCCVRSTGNGDAAVVSMINSGEVGDIVLYYAWPASGPYAYAGFDLEPINAHQLSFDSTWEAAKAELTEQEAGTR